jgi:hypothetical protein
MDAEPKLLGITFSDYVIREHGTGKLTLVGCFSVYNARQFPFTPPRFFVTASFTNLQGHIEALRITARVEDPQSSHVLASTSGEIKFPPDFQHKRNAVMELPIPMPRFTVNQPGDYKVVLLINNENVGDRPLTINPVSAAPTIQLDEGKEK